MLRSVLRVRGAAVAAGAALAAGLALAGAALGTTAPAPSPPGQRILYSVEYEQSGLSVDLKVNGVPLDQIGHDRDHLPSHNIDTINMWVRPGKNRLQVSAKPVASTSGANAAKAARLTVTVWLQRGADPAGRKPLAAKSWPEPGGAFTSAATGEIAFAADPAPPSELWTGGDNIKLDPKARAEILSLTEAFHRAVGSHDVETIMTMTDFRDREMARCLYMPEERVRAGHRSDAEDEKAERVWKIEPWNPRNIELTSVADGLLVAVTAKGQPAVNVDMGEARFLVPIYVGRIHGKWVLAR